MRQAVEQCYCHLGITKDIGPFTETQIGGDHDTSLLIELSEQMEQQGATRWTEGQIAQLIKDDEIKAQKSLSNLTCLVHGLFLFQRIDQINGGVEACLLAVMRDSLHRPLRRRQFDLVEMRLAIRG